jgi:Domain of Unknown Function (DUF1080)
MKNLFAILFFLTLSPLFAQNTEGGWIELINGKDMTGWKAVENPETWTVVENGIFQGVGKRAHLFYTGEHLKDGFKNFEIEVQVKTFKLANSGIYIHTKFQEKDWPREGFEIQVNNSHIGEGSHVELKRMGSLYGYRNLHKTFSKDSVWMTVKARVESNRVQIWVDNVQTVDYVVNEKSTKRDRQLSSGTFALQGHDVLSKMQYRSFKVRRLPDDARSQVEPPVLGQYFDSLRVWQNRQFGFIDINPHGNFTAEELTNYTHQTGINAALVVSPFEVDKLKMADNKPIFKGLRIKSKDLKKQIPPSVDFVVGESADLKNAVKLISSGKIQILAYRGKTLDDAQTTVLLDLAKKNNVAIEIDNIAKTPSVAFIKMAKEKGCKFNFSGLIPVSTLANPPYILEAAKAAGLSYKDLFIPKLD